MSHPGSRLVLFALLLTLLFANGCSKKEAGAAGSGTDSTEVASDNSSDADDASDEEGDDEGDDSSGKKSREKSTTVNAAKVFRGELVVPVIAEGTIRTRHSAEVRAEIGGRIDKIHVTEGQLVRAGDKIAELDGREYQILVEEAHARYLAAIGQIAVEKELLGKEDDTAEIRAKLDELDDLEKSGKITRAQKRDQEVDITVQALQDGHFRRELIESRSGLNQARADEDRARLNLSRTIIRAPFAGTVSNLTLSAGHLLGVGETICSLVDNINVEADVGVLESELAGLEKGRPVLLFIPALQETLRAQVDVISPSIDTESRTCQVLMRLQNTNGNVRPDMFVRAAIAGKIYPDRLLIPNEAILSRDGRPLVFRVEDDQAKWVYVKLGLRNDQFSEVDRVLQGGPLDPGTLVVVSDHLTLSHDAKVKVRRVVNNRVAWSNTEAEY
jgi:RND family efflux transporter MFP subunit